MGYETENTIFKIIPMERDAIRKQTWTAVIKKKRTI